MWLLILPVVFIILSSYTFYWYLTRNFSYWKDRNVQFIPPTPLFGNLGSVFTVQQSIGVYLHETYEKYSHLPFIGLFTVDTPVLLLRDLDIIKTILIKDFNIFPNRSFTANHREPLMAFNLFGLKGGPWKELRSKLTPCFTGGKIKNMTVFMQTCAKQLDDMIEISVKHNQNKPFLMKHLMSKYTTDVISTCTFGVEGHAISNPETDDLYKIGTEMFTPSLRQTIQGGLSFFAPKLRELLPLKRNREEIYDICRNLIWSTIRYREEKQINRNDFLDILRDLRDTHTEINKLDSKVAVIDGDLLVAQAFVFIVAGYETASSLISFACYELAKNPEIQERARKEVKECLKNHQNEMSYDCLKSMKHLDQVLNETLRMYPPLPFLDRICEETYQIPGTKITIDPGTKVFISLSGLHRDPKYYPNPNQFNPDNFNDENLQKRDKYSFLPFGEGPRYCIGMRFGMLQSKIALATVLNKYTIHTCEETPTVLKYSPRLITTASVVDLPLVLRKIE